MARPETADDGDDGGSSSDATGSDDADEPSTEPDEPLPNYNVLVVESSLTARSPSTKRPSVHQINAFCTDMAT